MIIYDDDGIGHDVVPMSVIEDIKAEIAEDLSNAEKESKQTQDDVDAGICIGLQMALDMVEKHISGKE